MKINELRNGNIAVCNVVIGSTAPIETRWNIGTPAEWMEPIQISEEWLVKMGFEKVFYDDEGHYYCKDIPGLHPLCFLSSDDFASVSLFDYEKEFKYVHEVQNIYFALTGEEIL